MEHGVKKRIADFLLIIFLLSQPFLDSGEFEFWYTQNAKASWTKNLDVRFEGVLRWDHNASRLYLQYAQWGIGWDLGCGWEITPQYRQQTSLKEIHGHTRWQTEAIPLVDFTRTLKHTAYQLASRTRFEWRTRRKDWLYRQRFKVNLKSKNGLDPYVFEEFFLERGQNWTQNRFAIGVNLPFAEFLNPSIGYMMRHRRSPGQPWSKDSIILLNSAIDF